MFEVEIAPEVQKQGEDALTVVETALVFTIQNEDQFTRAGELGVQIQTLKRGLEEQLEEIREPIRESKRQADKAMKKAAELFSPWLTKLEAAGTKLQSLMNEYRAEQRRQTKLLAERAEAEARAKAKEEAEARAKVADALREQGLEKEAEKIANRPLPVAAPVAVYSPPAPKVAGVVPKTFKAAKVDLAAQYQHLKTAIDNWNGFHRDDPAKLIVPSEFWKLDQDDLDDRAKKTDGMVPIPGVEFYEVDKTTFRRRR